MVAFIFERVSVILQIILNLIQYVYPSSDFYLFCDCIQGLRDEVHSCHSEKPCPDPYPAPLVFEL